MKNVYGGGFDETYEKIDENTGSSWRSASSSYIKDDIRGATKPGLRGALPYG